MRPSPLTRYATSPDGVCLAYDSSGAGPALVLLPGHSDDRRAWHTAGYVSCLCDRFTGICLDPRGQGESDRTRDPAAYALDRVLADVCAVADACGAERFAVWGATPSAGRSRSSSPPAARASPAPSSAAATSAASTTTSSQPAALPGRRSSPTPKTQDASPSFH